MTVFRCAISGKRRPIFVQEERGRFLRNRVFSFTTVPLSEKLHSYDICVAKSSMMVIQAFSFSFLQSDPACRSSCQHDHPGDQVLLLHDCITAETSKMAFGAFNTFVLGIQMYVAGRISQACRVWTVMWRSPGMLTQRL